MLRSVIKMSSSMLQLNLKHRLEVKIFFPTCNRPWEPGALGCFPIALPSFLRTLTVSSGPCRVSMGAEKSSRKEADREQLERHCFSTRQVKWKPDFSHGHVLQNVCVCLCLDVCIFGAVSTISK